MMAGPPKKMTARQLTALTALLTYPNLTQAAAASNLGERTLFRYLRDPQFAKLYQRARHDQLAQAIAALQIKASEAVNVLFQIAKDPQGKATARVAAARAIVDGALKASEMENIEGRLAMLEQRVKGAA